MGRKKKDNVVLFKRVPKELIEELKEHVRIRLKEYVETKVKEYESK